MDIRFDEESDHGFWFSLDRHLSEEEFLRKVRDQTGYVLTAEAQPIGVLRWSLFWDSMHFKVKQSP